LNILVVAQYYYPEQFRTNDICKQLAKDGHSVTVLTGIPNYPEGKYYSGYGVFRKRSEIHEGVKIIRTLIIPRGKTKFKLILNYLSFVFFGCLKAVKLAKEDYDLVFVYETSPITMAIPAISVSKLKKIPLIMYVTDLWPESVQAVGAVNNKFILGQIGKIVDYIYRQCDKILVSSKSFMKAISQRGHSLNKIVFWPQYAEELFQKEPTNIIDVKKDIPSGFNIVFTGNIGEAQGLEVVIRAAEKLIDYPDIHWILIGDGRAKAALINKVKERNLQKHIRFLERKPIELMPAYLALADAALITLKKDPIFSMTIPAKLQSYMACGVPVIASIEGEVASIVRTAGAGLVCDAGDSDGLAEIVLKLYRMSTTSRQKYGINGREFFLNNFSKKKLMRELYTILEEQVNKGK
jgi:colanic acid biosynthesis glycosyl transferase WcaI